ncbi:hypothetical protein P170DRAFT_433990 [Aspergillus steynii IBT 23096]|uniref:Uncharacterized protein n=1 Tax=Aspergillus steynii IBT 23096 TaxID=1392250 RepID=A0A2I2GGZ4_9EURO|nr:uncharacterized protein P170DRAFT_433990 [Aspergillus steynii IBT 23096]PLB52151.1 hypothetical protein P170DRAFT_433990 [Aspergillus steynii IBT 23096]
MPLPVLTHPLGLSGLHKSSPGARQAITRESIFSLGGGGAGLFFFDLFTVWVGP